MKEILNTLAKQTANKIDEWYFSYKDSHIKWKYRIVISESTGHSMKKFTLYPARWRNAKKPISTLTI